MANSEESVVCRLQYSRAGAAVLVVAALGTAALLLALPIAAGAALLAVTAIACATLEAVHRVALLRGRRGVRSLRLSRDGAIAVEQGDGASVAGLVQAGGFVAPWLVIVRWRVEGERFDRTLLLLRGMTDAETLRKIRVILRWG